MVLRGIWSLSQPWGSFEEKFFGLAFFIILFLFSLYQFLRSLNVISKQLAIKFSPHLVSAIVCFVFVAGGIFMFANGNPLDRMLGSAGIIFFGASGVVYLRWAYLKKQD